MTHITIIIDAADIARHQANVDAFLAKHRNQLALQAFADAELDEAPTDAELVYVLAEAFDMSMPDMADRLARVDVAALREAVAP